MGLASWVGLTGTEDGFHLDLGIMVQKVAGADVIEAKCKKNHFCAFLIYRLDGRTRGLSDSIYSGRFFLFWG